MSIHDYYIKDFTNCKQIHIYHTTRDSSRRLCGKQRTTWVSLCDQLFRLLHTSSIYTWTTETFIYLFIALSITAQAQSTVGFNSIFDDPVMKTQGNSQNAVNAFNNLKNNADQSYTSAHYHEAFRIYQRLALYGHKFSQYRLAFMYWNGQGSDKNDSQALAWAYVAAEKQTEPALGLFRTIKNTMSDEQIADVEPLAMEYLHKYGISATSRLAYNTIRRELRNCTGSRIGTRCDRVYASSLNCNTASHGMPGKNCLILGIAGLPGVQRMQPLVVRQALDRLQILAASYEPGNITFGEFQIVDDIPDPVSSNTQFENKIQYKPLRFSIDGIIDDDENSDGTTDDNENQ